MILSYPSTSMALEDISVILDGEQLVTRGRMMKM